MTDRDLIYKICQRAEWQAALDCGSFDGSAVDLADGYIHFSTASQARETAAKHFRGQADLLLIGVKSAALGRSLKWEPSRGGDLFPHLYGPLDVSHAHNVQELPLDAQDIPILPEGF